MLAEQSYELVPLEKLSEHPENPRRGDVDAIGSSIAANGFYGAVVAQRSTGHVLAGNHRLKAARAEGLVSLPVIWVDVDDDRARRILLVDNRSGDLASYDEAGLLALLEDLDSTDAALAGTAWDQDAMDDLRISLEKMATLPPAPTGAAYAENDEEHKAREEHVDSWNPIGQAAMREVILAYTIEDHNAVLHCIGLLRGNRDVTGSQVVLEALRIAAGMAESV